MARIKRSIGHLKKRRSIMKRAKGFRLGRRKTIRLAATAIKKAGAHAFRGRKQKKQEKRRLWQIKINAAARPLGISYSKMIGGLKKNKIELDRKILAELAEKHPAVFAEILKKIKA